ncbi:hypothetical protein GCM10023231_28370 [Olivibacter ginsenosidimutans]|uniref:DUF306 domain-containing protein n=1 Tax=Olivibacter ginsenosidimutans TaxID=1176537 RepID=A0ABP9BST6_9SPHI
MKRIISIFTIALVFSACGNVKHQDQQATDDEKTENPSSLYDKEWRLLSIDGEPIKVDSTFAKFPNLTFKEDSLAFSGSGGCNGYGGKFQLEENNGISFPYVAATEMACPNMELEQRFFDALRNTKSYLIKSDTLTLYKDGNVAAGYV